MSFLASLTSDQNVPPPERHQQHPSLEFVAMRDADLANAEGALLSLYQDLEEHRDILEQEKSLRKQLQLQLSKRDAEIQHLVHTITDIRQEGDGKRWVAAEKSKRERELEEKVKMLESQ